MPGILKETRQEFKKTLAGSFVMHILVIALALLAFNTEPKRTFFSPVYTVDLVASAPQRTIAAEQMPVVRPAGPRPAPPAPPEAVKKESAKAKSPAAAKEKAIALKPRAAAIDEALKKVAADVKKKQDRSTVESAIEELQKRRESESRQVASRINELKKELATRPKPAAPGTSAPQTGARGGANRDLETKYPAYFSVIHDRVQDAWSVYSEDLKDSKLSLIVSVKIERSGRLLETHIEKSSGDAHFDESLIKAIRKTEFPRLPEDFEGDTLETGFRFCPSCGR